MVVSDGAKFYPRLHEKHGLLHASCSLAKTIRCHHGNLNVHTGTTDGAWRLLKQAIPDQLVTKRCKNKAEINSSLWTYIQTRQWQWEVGHTGDACMKATGKRLSYIDGQCIECRGLDARNRRRNAKKAFLGLCYPRHKQDSIPFACILLENA